jgi:hypothetical protein
MNKRRFKRYEVSGLHGRTLFSTDIDILNISMDGAAIATLQRLSLGREYAIKIRAEGDDFTLRGIVVWSMLSHSRTLENGEVAPVYRAGIRFTNTLTSAAMQLMSYIENNRSDSMEQRVLGVRFKVNQSGASALDLSRPYIIKKISLSGMLIETDACLRQGSLQDLEIMLNGMTVPVSGRIAYLTEVTVNDTVRYDVGIEFIAMTEEDRGRLKRYLDGMEHHA